MCSVDDEFQLSSRYISDWTWDVGGFFACLVSEIKYIHTADVGPMGLCNFQFAKKELGVVISVRVLEAHVHSVC